MRNKIIKFIVTGFYVGLIPVMPGTFGSLLAFPICFYLMILSSMLHLKITIAGIEPFHQEILAMITLLFASCFAMFLIGSYLTSKYIKTTGREDPKEVVIDEIVGQMLTILLSSLASIFVHNSSLSEKLSPNTIDFIFLFALPFGLFRFFDIVKPWPINWLDKNIKGGIGVMLDDILAAIFAITMCYAITFTIVGHYTNAT